MNRTEEREALYTAYSEKVRGYMFGKVANRHDAEDRQRRFSEGV